MWKLSSLLFGCMHEFGWPRKDESGNCYQQCLKCGAEYTFDWIQMRRGEKLAPGQSRASMAKSLHKPGSSWKPRERRIAWQVEVQYRLGHSSDWLEGLAENISRSGLMFRSIMKLERGTPISLMLEMPEQITGHDDSKVFCSGEVARCLSAPHGGPGFLVAVRIKDYRFLYSPLAREEKKPLHIQ